MEEHACVKCGKKLFGEIPFCPHCGEKQPGSLSEQEKSKNPYEILQISESAEIEVIEAAYKSLSKKYHPDVDSSPSAEEKMKDINWAYEILSDPKRRTKWKRERKSKPEPTTRKYEHNIYCLYCGKEVTSDAIVCPHCGRAIAKEREGPSEFPPRKCETEKSTTMSPPPYKRALNFSDTTSLIGAILFIGIVLLVASGLCYQSGTSSKPNSQPTRTKTTRPYPTSIKRPTNTDASPQCIRWDMVNNSHVGKEICVYGENRSRMTTEEYVLVAGYSGTFHIFSQLSLPDIRFGVCLVVKGVVQVREPYYYYIVISDRNDYSTSSSLCK